MLERQLETEVMDDADDAREFDTMDHSQVNRQFVDDLLEVCDGQGDILDIGTGTALIPIELCERVESCRVMAADQAIEMLELARYRIEVSGLIERIQLDHCDAKQMHYEDAMFHIVMSNSIVHHLADPAPALAETVRVTAKGGRIFFRDLLRPHNQESLEQLVTEYAGDATPRQQQLFRQSLHAALNLPEIQDLVQACGFPADSVQPTSDRHWTWTVQLPEAN